MTTTTIKQWLSAALFCAVLPTFAQAETRSVCSSFAKRTYHKVKEFRGYACRRRESGLIRRYQSKYLTYRRCLSQSMRDLRREESMLAAKKRKCDVCSAYASKAVTSHYANRRRRCHFGGAAWHGNYTTHFNWCMGASYRDINRQSNLRAARLRACRPRMNCRSYAVLAVKQQQQNLHSHCGFHGFGWHTNYNTHFRWCLGQKSGVPQRHARSRAARLSRCKPRLSCRTYASSAVAQQRTNLVSRCGFRGFGWHGDYTTHYKWCLGQNAGVPRRHHNSRAAQLRRCRSRMNCSTYARSAVSQQRTNLSRGCGFRGFGWHTNFRTHYNWCTGQRAGGPRSHHTSRARAITRCLSFCKNYAKRAIEQNRANQAMRCGHWGVAWHSNFYTHYNWCKGQSMSSARREQSNRDRDLRRCRARRR